jgi:hypothetical protein
MESSCLLGGRRGTAAAHFRNHVAQAAPRVHVYARV